MRGAVARATVRRPGTGVGASTWGPRRSRWGSGRSPTCSSRPGCGPGPGPAPRSGWRRWPIARARTPRDLGCDGRDLGAGIRLGAGAAAAIVGVTAVGRALDRTGSRFRDERVTDATTGEAAVQLLVRIPLATALGEELVFRGVILGLGRRDGDDRRALLVSSVAFGLWHVGVALHPERRRAAGDVVSPPRAAAPAAVVGDVMATTVGGLGFGWLRLRSGSIAAPTLAHAALNASAYVATRFRSSAARLKISRTSGSKCSSGGVS